MPNFYYILTQNQKLNNKVQNSITNYEMNIQRS